MPRTKKQARTPPPLPAGWERCHEFRRQKNKYCKQVKAAGSDYCVYHGGADDRVPCPIDPTHCVRAADVEAHTRKCSRLEVLARPPHPALAKGINLPPVDTTGVIATPMRAADPALLAAFFDALDAAFARLVADPAFAIVPDVRCHPVLAEHVTAPGRNVKHLAQLASLMGHLDGAGLVSLEYMYVEPGAGKGSFCGAVGDVLGIVKSKTRMPGEDDDAGIDLSALPGPLFVLLEREKRRSVHDSAGRKDVSMRIVEDIADIDLAKLDDARAGRKMVVVAKHLCGGATDLALHMITRDPDVSAATAGVLIAQCCFGKMSADVFGALPLLAPDGLDVFFPWLRRTATWPTSVPDPPFVDLPADEWLAAVAAIPWSSDPSVDPLAPTVAHLSIRTRVALGLKARTVIAAARAAHLAAAGFSVSIIEYISAAHSPQNLALFATRP